MYLRQRSRGFGQVSSGVQTIAATIQKIEGYYPGTLAYTNNNPGNLIYLPSSSIQSSNGATQGASGFAAFPTYQDGLNALYAQIQAYGTQGLTIQQMMNKYAPATDSNGNPTGNDPTAYANSIAASLGVSPNSTVASAISGPLIPALSADTSGVTDISGDLSSDFADLTGSTVDPMTLAWGVLAAGLLIFGISQA